MDVGNIKHISKDQLDMILKGYEEAVKAIRKNITPMGFSTCSLNDNLSSNTDSDYRSVWGRDGSIAITGTIPFIKEKEIYKCQLNTLKTLLKHVSMAGQIPSNVSLDTGKPDYLGLGGICPFIGGGWVRYINKLGMRDLALKELYKLAELNKLGVFNEWEFNEWANGITGRPMGNLTKLGLHRSISLPATTLLNQLKSIKMKRILMMLLHGYVAAEPELGKPYNGGQVVYVLELAKRFGGLGIQVDLVTRQFEGQPEVDVVNDNFRIWRIPFGGDEFIRKEDMHDYLDMMIFNFWPRLGLPIFIMILFIRIIGMLPISARCKIDCRHRQ